MLLCRGLMNTSSSMLRSRASTALPGVSKDSWEVDSFSFGRPRDLEDRRRKRTSAKSTFVRTVLQQRRRRKNEKTPGRLPLSEPHSRLPSTEKQERSNTYEKQPQSQVRGVPQSIPPPPPRLPPAPTVLPPRPPVHWKSCRAERRLYRASPLCGRW